LTSKTTPRFRDAFRALPAHIQVRARQAYRRFAEDPGHPSLRFRQVHATHEFAGSMIAGREMALMSVHV
jgi:hypothetical protein